MNNIIQINELLGAGSDGEIYKCIYRGEVCVAKKYEYQTAGFNSGFLREISFLKNVRHKSIIKMIDVVIDGGYVYIILELLEKSLVDIVCDTQYNPDKLMTQIIDCIKYIHGVGYVHGDLSINNVMHKNGIIKIIDTARSTKVHRKNIVYGPTSYIAPPELISRNLNNLNNSINIDPVKMDIWALGCLLYFIQTKNILFMGKDYDTQMDEITKNLGIIYDNNKHVSSQNLQSRSHNIQPITRTKIKKTLADTSKQINIGKMLNINYMKRSKLTDFNENAYTKMLNYDTTNNLTTYEIHRVLIRLMDINSKFLLPIESIFITLNNIFRIQSLKKIYLNDNIIVALHKLSLTVSTDYLITDKYFHTSQITLSTCANIELMLMKNLEWNVDPVTCYDYIGQKENGTIFEIVLLLCCFTGEFCVIADIHKLQVVKIIVESIEKKYTRLNFTGKEQYRAIVMTVISKIHILISTKYLYFDIMVNIIKYIDAINYKQYFQDIMKGIFYIVHDNSLMIDY